MKGWTFSFADKAPQDFTVEGFEALEYKEVGYVREIGLEDTDSDRRKKCGSEIMTERARKYTGTVK